MAEKKERKDNTGALFRAEKDWTAEKSGRPSYTGRVKIGGASYFVSGWPKEHADVVGGSYISLAFKLVEDVAEGTPF